MIITTILLALSLTDLLLTFYYVKKYKEWQPNKDYNLIERNPLLTLLWRYFGLFFGHIIGGIMILGLIYFISRTAHIYISIFLGLFISLAIYNHFKNIRLLNKLIGKYPSGHLPEKTFGKVQGNN